MNINEIMDLPVAFTRHGKQVGKVSDIVIGKNLKNIKIKIGGNRFVTSNDVVDCREGVLVVKNLQNESGKSANRPKHCHIDVEHVSAEASGHFWWLRVS